MKKIITNNSIYIKKIIINTIIFLVLIISGILLLTKSLKLETNKIINYEEKSNIN